MLKPKIANTAKVSLRFIIPLLLVVGGLSSLASADSYIKNGNFDNSGNPLDGWTSDAKGGTFQTPPGDTGNCVWLNHNGSEEHDPSVSQDMVGLTVGEEYIVSGKYKGGKTANAYAKPGHPMLAIDIDNEPQVKVVATTLNDKIDTENWLTFSANFKATKSTHNLCIRGEIDGKDADVYVDSITVQKVPPIIENGSFDEDSNTAYAKWTIENIDHPVANQHDEKGNGYIWLNHAGKKETDPSISQQMKNLKNGTQYLVSGKYKVGKTADAYGGKPGDDLLAVDIDGKEISKTAPAPSVEGHANQLDKQHWLSFSASFTDSQDMQMLRIRGEIDGKDADVYLDDVSVSEEANK